MANDVPLREYIETKLDAMEQATKLAADSLGEKLEGMNQFREEIKDYTSKLTTRQECQAFRDSIDKDLRTLRDFKTAVDAKASQTSVYIAWLIAIGGFVVGIISLVRE